MVGLNCLRNAVRKFNRNLWGANQRQPFRSHDLSTSQGWWVLLGIGRMLAVPEIQPAKIRRNVWWVLTVPEMQPVNLEGMYGEPIRDNHLDHMFYVSTNQRWWVLLGTQLIRCCCWRSWPITSLHFLKTCPYMNRWVLCPRNPIFTLSSSLPNNIIKKQLNLPTTNWKLTLTGLKRFKRFFAEQLYHPASLDAAWNVHSLPWCCTSAVVWLPLYQVIFGSGLPSTGQERVTWVPSGTRTIAE